MKEVSTVIRRLRITEKGSQLSAKQNKYLVEVDRSANKNDIRRAVETMFKVHVTGVNTAHRQGKKKRERSMQYGRTARWKQAVVTLRQGETLEAS